jgi:tRNA(Met) cytidine acetyltransferase
VPDSSPERSPLERLAEALRAAARRTHQRRVLLLAGGSGWCRRQADGVLSILRPEEPLWVGTHAPAGTPSTPADRASKLLGRECDALVFDAHEGFDPNAFGAVAGTLRGGGLLLLLAPALTEWGNFPDPEKARVAVHPFTAGQVSGRFLRRLAAVARTSPGVTVVTEGEAIPDMGRDEAVETAPFDTEESPQPTGHAAPWTHACRTPDQAAAVEAIVHTATGHRRRPVVLVSDRGRGKSSALGIAAAHLLRQGGHRILVTAPRREAAAAVFEQAARLLPEADAARGDLHLDGARLAFAPPDALSLEPRPADLLLVDEAAAIPTPLLTRLLAHYPRIVFATTVHGYEGTGRGFAVRFRRVLDTRTPGWRALNLVTPVRWARHDPMEAFVFRALLLDAAAAPDEAVASADPATCTLERLDRECLAEDEATLGELFGLLVLAHYRTSPLDLRHLLDGPNLSVYVARHERHVVATALVAEEGGFDAQMATAVYAGRRRPRGHLIPQSLAAHAGLEAAPRRRFARVMRIAVHPAIQGRGLGTQLLERIVEDARARGLDAAGASFGATPELLSFWARSGFRPVRVGVSREATSGTHSVMMLRPLSSAGEALATAATDRLQSQLPALLSEPLRDLDPALAAMLLADAPAEPPAPQDWRDLIAFAFARRTYEVTLAPLRKLTLTGLTDTADALTAEQWALLVSKILQGRGWAETAGTFELAGRAAVIEALRDAARTLILNLGDGEAIAEAKRLAALDEPPADEE